MGRPPGSKNKNKTKSTAPGASALKEAQPENGIGHNGHSDDDLREAFLDHVRSLKTAKLEVEEARAGLKLAKETLKADGFTVKAVEDAILAETPEGEVKIRERLAATIRAMRWMGSAVGTQFTFDLDSPDRTPGVDRARDEGKVASMEGLSRQPPGHYHPGTEFYRAWFEGYDNHQEQRIREGIKPMEQDVRPRHIQRREVETSADGAFEGDGTKPAA